MLEFTSFKLWSNQKKLARIKVNYHLNSLLTSTHRMLWNHPAARESLERWSPDKKGRHKIQAWQWRETSLCFNWKWAGARVLSAIVEWWSEWEAKVVAIGLMSGCLFGYFDALFGSGLVTSTCWCFHPTSSVSLQPTKSQCYQSHSCS